MTVTLPKWFDLHAHFRQGPAMRDYVQAHLNMGCAGVLAMPNTQPPVSRISGVELPDSRSIESYHMEMMNAGADAFEQIIIPLYLTPLTTAAMIHQGSDAGRLLACKYYPPHGTTNSEHGLPMEQLIHSDVLRAMEERGIVLCIHGEQHALHGPEYIDVNQNAETRFYQETMPRLLEAHPRLKIVCEHITTRVAANFVASAPKQVGATITPQHLLFTLGHLIQGLKYHLYCLPVLKFEDDREALREQILTLDQRKFFAGTDSAPHSNKVNSCGCAAGCFTGGCAPQLYAMAFEEAGVDFSSNEGLEKFKAFLCHNGPNFYGFPISNETFVMEKTPSETVVLETAVGPLTPLPTGLQLGLVWTLR